jgi:hypothetical protein
MDAKIAHLQMIQAVIERLSNASFVIRGWAVTLVAAVFALSAKDADRRFFLIAYLPILAFWLLDSFYLSRERTFRAIYSHVAKMGNDEVDFSMDTKPFHYSWPRACVAVTPVLFYAVLAISTCVLIALGN